MPSEPGLPEILSVTELNGRIKDELSSLGRLAVEGEIAGLRRPASGHLYFNLKDRSAGVESVLGCVIWRSQLSRASKQPLEEGQSVIAHGKLDVYGPRGSYSLVVERAEPRGMGALLEQLEKLKHELSQKGWFDERQPLPRFPRLVGVVTSRDGAAFQDFLRTRSMRWPGYPVRLVHTPVQGPGAAERIAAAIAALDASGVAVIVVTRGGGSLEDLWCFNERVVAEAIWKASVPVVSGVGHETDSTLADLVADHRAHTPTDAAQTVIPLQRELMEKCERQFNYLLAAVDENLARRSERVERAADSRVLAHPDWILGDREGALAGLGERLSLSARRQVGGAEDSLQHALRVMKALGPAARLSAETNQLAALSERLARPCREHLSSIEARLDLDARQLEALSPYAVLGRGYSITRLVGAAEPLTEVEGLKTGVRLETRLAKGRFESTFEGPVAEEDS
ncbi:MAG: exodeoxyribonuclease VII large subunit [bacterium]